MIWFASDLHFHHSKPFLYESRGFQTFIEHDAAVIHNWNSVVKPEDEVFLLGDIMLEDNDYGIECFKQLNGKIHIIVGNHDSDVRIELYKECPNVVDVKFGDRIKYGKHTYWLSHHPSLTGNFTDNNNWRKTVWNLCGHRHDSDRFCQVNEGPIYHCELDAHNNCPVSIEEIESDIRKFYEIKE